MLTPKTPMKPERKSEILEVRHAGLNAYGDDHQVVSVKSPGSAIHRKKPCPNCPWRVDAVGEFPAEAFRHSAETAYDMSNKIFACHEAGTRLASSAPPFARVSCCAGRITTLPFDSNTCKATNWMPHVTV